MAILLNFFFPGIGSFLIGKPIQAALQLVLFIVGLFFVFTGVGVFIGAPLCFIAWLWGIISAAQGKKLA